MKIKYWSFNSFGEKNFDIESKHKIERFQATMYASAIDLLNYVSPTL